MKRLARPNTWRRCICFSHYNNLNTLCWTDPLKCVFLFCRFFIMFQTILLFLNSWYYRLESKLTTLTAYLNWLKQYHSIPIQPYNNNTLLLRWRLQFVSSLSLVIYKKRFLWSSSGQISCFVQSSKKTVQAPQCICTKTGSMIDSFIH